MQPRISPKESRRDTSRVGGHVDPAVSSRVDPVAFAAAVLAVTEGIPVSRVLTYGDIAELLECGGPRQVGRALSHSTRAVPWWRVVRAGGHPPQGLAARARLHYEQEGTVLRAGAEDAGPDDYRVDLRLARWEPSAEEYEPIAELIEGLIEGFAGGLVGGPGGRPPAEGDEGEPQRSNVRGV